MAWGSPRRTANDIFDTGAGVITTGNHVYRHRDAYEFLEREQRVVRPANYPRATPAAATPSSRPAACGSG